MFLHTWYQIFLSNTDMYLQNPPHGQDVTQGQFLSGVSIQSFPSPRLVASSRLKNQSVLLYTHSWMENRWIHTFPKGISAMWTEISLVQDLNSCSRVHFLRQINTNKLYTVKWFRAFLFTNDNFQTDLFDP